MLKVTSTKTQNQRVLDHLIDHGFVTQVIASSYGIRRLASRINDLKKEGARVESIMKTDDAGVRYAYYTLIDPQAERSRRELGMSWRV